MDQPQQRRSSPSHSRSHSRDHNGRGAQAATGYQPPALPAAPGAQIASNSADAAAAGASLGAGLLAACRQLGH